MRQGSGALSKALEAKVERVARRLRKPRRAILKEAIEEYLTRHDPQAITEAMNRVADAVDTRLDPALATAAAGMLRRSEW